MIITVLVAIGSYGFEYSEHMKNGIRMLKLLTLNIPLLLPEETKKTTPTAEKYGSSVETVKHWRGELFVPLQ